MEPLWVLRRPRARLWLGVWWGVASAQILLLLWVHTEQGRQREVDSFERVLFAAMGRLVGVVGTVEEAVKEAMAQEMEKGVSPEASHRIRELFREHPIRGVAIRRGAGAVEFCWPPSHAPLAEKVSFEGHRGWAFVDAGEGATGGVIALRVAHGEDEGIVFMDLPGLLAASFDPQAAGTPLVVWVEPPEAGPRFFICDAQLASPGGWRCSEWRQGPKWGSRALGPGRVELHEGTAVGRAWRVGEDDLTVGLFVPKEQGTKLSTVLLLLLMLWAFLTGSVVLAWRRWTHLEAQEAGALAAMSRHEAEVSARTAEAFWRVLLDGVKEPLLFLRGGLIVRANQAASRLLGYEHRADLIGKTLDDLLAPEDRERIKKLLPAANLSRSAFTASFWNRQRERRSIEVFPWALDVAGEQMTCLSLEDFTTRERTEQILRAVLASASVGVVFLDPNGRVVWGNQTAASALGVRPEDLNGLKLLPFVAPESRLSVKRAFVRALRQESADVAARCRCRGDLLSAFHLVFRKISVAGGLVGVVVIGERAGLGSEQPASEDLFASIHELVVHFLHDIANTIQASLASSSKGTGSSKTLRSHLHEVGQLIRQLGVFFRLHGPGFVTVDLNQLVMELEGELSEVLPEGVRLVACPWHAPALVSGDVEQLKAFLLGVTEASAECLRGGVGTVEVAVEQGIGGVYRLAVSDTGEVFAGNEERRWVLSARLRARGFAYCLARRHLGEAGFRERVGFGGRVWVDLPAAASAAEDLRGSKPRRGKVLIVDDESAVREGLSLLVQSEGYEVLEAANGREALAQYDADPDGIALVVLDLVMPEMSGREVYAELMRRPNPPHIVLATGRDPGGDPFLGSARVLSKPFTAEAFLRVLRELVERPAP